MKTEAIRAACVRRFGAWAVSAAVLSGTTWMARAASFDCAKARSPQELLICSDPELSRLDREMGEAYRQHASRLSERARARVLASQRAWLVFWPRSCSRASQQIRLGVEELPCARDRYRERLAELWPVIPAPGLQSYFVVERRYLPPASADESPGRHEIKFPQVEVVTPQQAAPSLLGPLNAWLARDLARWGADLEGGSDSSLTVTLEALTPEWIHATESAEFYGHGAAHGQYSLRHHHFLPVAGRPLQPSDVFRNEAWSQEMAPMVMDRLRRQLGDDLQISKVDEVRKLIEPVSAWRFSPSGLEFHFNPYEVAPFSAGFVSVTIPAVDIRGYLTALGQRMLRR